MYQRYIEIKKFAADTKRATYFEFWKFVDWLDLDIKIKSAPITGNKINEDNIGKSIMI